MVRFFDWLAEAFGNFVRDVRQRVVERGWFSEAVTPRSQNISLRSLGEKSPADLLGWSIPKGGFEEREQARAAARGHDNNQEIER